jgi:hypothetical protein
MLHDSKAATGGGRIAAGTLLPVAMVAAHRALLGVGQVRGHQEVVHARQQALVAGRSRASQHLQQRVERHDLGLGWG